MTSNIVALSTQIELPKKEVPQYQSPQNKVPQIEQPKTKRSGYFKLAHSIFLEPKLQKVSGDCFKLFIWMSTRAWRYLNSNGVLRASISFIEDETSMSHASISRSLRTLKERGLIKIVETDFKKGNVWEVSPVSLSENIAEAPQSEIPQNNTEATSKRGGSSLKSREEVPQNEGEYKKYLININKNLKSEKTEISELEKFEALELFETLSPTTQDKIISDFRLQEFPHGFYPPEQVVRALAALKWQNRRQQNWMSPGF